jgi:hypothetical protein
MASLFPKLSIGAVAMGARWQQGRIPPRGQDFTRRSFIRCFPAELVNNHSKKMVEHTSRCQSRGIRKRRGKVRGIDAQMKRKLRGRYGFTGGQR